MSTVSSLSAFQGSNASIQAPSDQLDKETFLKLLVVQLRTQDPLTPIKNEDFIAQLAQFRSLESMNNIYEELNLASLLQQSTHNALSTSLIGKYSLIAGDEISVKDGAADQMVFILPQAGDVKITIVDEEGNTVKTIMQQDLNAGEHLVGWDGTDEEGEEVADGTYRVEIEYLTADGDSSSIGIYRAGLIRAVRFFSGSPVVVIGNEEHMLSEIGEVMEELPDA